MAKFTLNSILSGFQSISLFNSNNDKIEDHLNNRVLYRDNPLGEPNQMENNLDMNSNRILNLPTPVNDNEPARLVDLVGISVIDPNVITSVGTDNFVNESSVPGSTLTEVLNNINGGMESINTTLDSLSSWVSTDFVNKSEDTERSSTTTLAIDPHLSVTGLTPGQTYMVDAVLRVSNAGASSNFKWTIAAGDSGTSVDTESNSLVGTVFEETASGGFIQAGISTIDPAEGIISVSYSAPLTAIVVSGMIEIPSSETGADRIALYWSQKTSSATATTVLERSYLHLTKVEVPGVSSWSNPTNSLVYPIADPLTGGGAIINETTVLRPLTIQDTSSYIRCNHATGTVISVAPNTTVFSDFVIGAEVHFRQVGAGPITFFEAGEEVNIIPPFGGALETAGVGATVTLKKVAANTWELFGQTASA